MKYEKPKPDTALRRTRRGINPSPANPHSRTHGFVDAHPAPVSYTHLTLPTKA